MGQKIDMREEKRRMQRAWSRHLSFEQRLNEVFELVDICFEIKDAFRKNESKKSIQKPADRYK